MIFDGPWFYLLWGPALVGGLLLFAASSAGTWTAARRSRLRRLGSWLAFGTGLPAVVATAAFAVVLTGDWKFPAMLLTMTGATARLVADLDGDRVWAKPLMRAGDLAQGVGVIWWAYLSFGPKNVLLIAVACVGLMIVLSVAIRVASNLAKARSSGPGAQ